MKKFFLAAIFFSAMFVAVPRVSASAEMSLEDFAAVVDGAPRALWRLQATEAAKNVVKACVGRRGWNRLRGPLLRMWTAEERG